MLDRALLQQLHDDGLIDKRQLVWWQLGFEGRRLVTEEEFAAGLEERIVRISLDFEKELVIDPPEERTYKIWKSSDVPILVRDITVDGVTLPCFVTVKPVTHYPVLDEGSAPSVYERAHIRGISVETTPRHFFWHPMAIGENNRYMQHVFYLRGEESLPALNWAINQQQFCHNLIQKGWRGGRRAQRKPTRWNMTKEKFSVVPHYEFDPSQRHVTMYPVSLREGALDFPIIAQAVPDRAGVHVLGMGYFTFPSPKRAIAEYWKLPVRQQEVAHAALQARFASGTSLK